MFHILWNLLAVNGGGEISRIDDWAFEQDLRAQAMFSLWRRALEKRAGDAFHTLALHTEDEELADIMYLAVGFHDFRAIHSLLARLWRLRTDRLLPFIHCNGMAACADCAMIRRRLVSLHAHVFAKDFEFVREQFRNAAQSNVRKLLFPILSLRNDTDAIVEDIQLKSKKFWRILQFATFARILWRRWIERQLHPDSRYIRMRTAQFYRSVNA